MLRQAMLLRNTRKQLDQQEKAFQQVQYGEEKRRDQRVTLAKE